jgi:hypothetical protein
MIGRPPPETRQVNLEAPPDAPLILHLGAGLLLFAHIAGGTVGIVAGFVAMFARKGGRLHRRAGTAFFAGMLAMAGVGATVSPFLAREQWVNTTAAVFTLYLLVTGWSAGRRRDGSLGPVERLGLWVALALAASGPAAALGMARGQGGVIGAAYVFAGIAALAALGDARLVRAGRMDRRARGIRHLWRMSLSLAVACGAFFLGQPEFVPWPIRGTGLVVAPPLTALGLLAYWWVRTAWAARRRAETRTAAA